MPKFYIAHGDAGEKGKIKKTRERAFPKTTSTGSQVIASHKKRRTQNRKAPLAYLPVWFGSIRGR